MFYGFDPTFIILIPAIIFTVYAQRKVQSTYAAYSRVATRKGITGGQTARMILEEKKKRLDVSFVLDTLTYLARGGRCSAVAAFGANLMQLKPCIEVKDGKMGVGKKYRGKLDKCIVRYIHDKLADVDTLDMTRIFCTDSGVSDEIYAQAEAAIRECAPFKEIIHTRAGCTVSSHCGPNTLGILFYRK